MTETMKIINEIVAMPTNETENILAEIINFYDFAEMKPAVEDCDFWTRF